MKNGNFNGKGIVGLQGYLPHTKAVRFRGGGSFWWTEERKAKLIYIMEKYHDVDKAARVLGVEPWIARRQWKGILYSRKTKDGA